MDELIFRPPSDDPDERIVSIDITHLVTAALEDGAAKGLAAPGDTATAQRPIVPD